MTSIVVGGGISGLTTALALAEGGLDVELREASPRLGGALLTSPFAGRPAVDEGADAFLVRVPHAVELARRVGLGEDLTSPAAASAAVWWDRLHDLPAGLALGVPTEAAKLATSRLLSVRGRARAALEPLLPRRGNPGDSIGALVRARFGHEVHERLVDALVGSIYGADTDRFSLAMVPQLAALAEGGRSLMLSGRALRATAPTTTGPIFAAPIAGMGALAAATADAARAAGVTIRMSTGVAAVEPDGPRWRVDGDVADVVVLATPARTTAPLVAAAPEASRLLGAMEHSSVVIVTIAVDGWPARLRGRSGYLVPKPVQRTVTAASFGSQKWAHWADGGRDDEVLRISLGRDGLPVDHLDDDTLVDRAVTEVGRHLSFDFQPTAVRVSRWPAAFPQYRPGHRAWLAAIDAALPTGLFVTGASYDGIGVPACVAQATATAARIQRREPGRLVP